MNDSMLLLSFTAVSIGFIHTLLGPDHYVPFMVLSEAKKWSLKKTMLITLACGAGHVLSSVILGLIGIATGISLNKLIAIESFRGNIAAWLFIAFGLVYTIISIRNLVREKKHSHHHFHSGGENHFHEHDHLNDHTHIHDKDVVSTTPWILFLIFVFGPCEPLIPILMYPAAKNDTAGAVLVSALFSAVTIATMMSVVAAFKMGFSLVFIKPFEKFGHLAAGTMIFLSGLAIQFLGL
jgi:sulfite exporter TauE/SafE